MHARRILVVTYYYPPDTSIGGRRWDAMARSLRELGHEITVVTTEAWGADPADLANVVRTRDLAASRRLRRLLHRPALPRQGESMALQTAAPAFLADGLVPDAYLATWVIPAVRAARRIVANGGIDCVVTSGPPHSTHLVGLFLGKTRPAWVADFRDGWTFEPPRSPWPTRSQARIDAWLERRAVSAANVTVGVTGPIVDDLALRLQAKAALVPNGWDPSSVLAVSPELPLLDPGQLNVVHTGLLSAEGGRDPRPLLDAMWDLHRSGDQRARRIRLILAGRLSEADLKILSASPPNVVHVGHLTPLEAFALQREADALLLLTAVGRRSEATGKLFEYLSSGRPIVALAVGNEAARIVEETRTGITAPPDDRGAIFDSLMAVADGRLAGAYTPAGLDQYVYPGPAREFAVQIERAIGLASHARAAPELRQRGAL